MAVIFTEGFDNCMVGPSGYNRHIAVSILSRAIQHLLDHSKPDMQAMVLIRRRIRMIEAELLSDLLREKRSAPVIEPQFPYNGPVYLA